MNEKSSRLRQEQKQEGVSESRQQQQATGAKEFGSVEEALREDAAQVVVPPAIATRLNDSIAKEPKPPPSWWQRLFGKS